MAVPDSRPDAQHTAAHLTLALLGYFALVTLVITLSPFDFAPRRLPRVSWPIVPSDMVANVALFLPLGFLLRGLAGDRRARGGRVVLTAAGFSALIETAQIFIAAATCRRSTCATTHAAPARHRAARSRRAVGGVAPALVGRSAWTSRSSDCCTCSCRSCG